MRVVIHMYHATFFDFDFDFIFSLFLEACSDGVEGSSSWQRIEDSVF